MKEGIKNSRWRKWVFKAHEATSVLSESASSDLIETELSECHRIKIDTSLIPRIKEVIQLRREQKIKRVIGIKKAIKKRKAKQLSEWRETKKQLAEHLKANPTKAEVEFRSMLDSFGVSYEFQPMILGYIPDFYFRELRIVVEIDGGIHLKQQKYDHHRDLNLEKSKRKVIRFTNDEVFHSKDHVLRVLRQNKIIPPHPIVILRKAR